MNIQKIKAAAFRKKVDFDISVVMREVDTKATTSAHPYMDVVFVDSSGSMTSKAWENSYLFTRINIDQLKPNLACRISGQAKVGKYGLDVLVNSIRPLEGEELRDFYVGSPEEIQAVKTILQGIVKRCAQVLDPRIRGVCEWCLDFLQRDKLWLRTVASRDGLYSTVGGLLRRTDKLLRLVDGVCEAVPELNRDLLVAGALLQDMGRTAESVLDDNGFGVSFSVSAELSGHTSLSARLLEKAWAIVRLDLEDDPAWKEDPKPALVLDHLRHMVLSHQGKPEWGAAVHPKTQEATVLHALDGIVLKLSLFEEGYLTLPEAGDSGDILDWCKPLGTRIVRSLGKWKQ